MTMPHLSNCDHSNDGWCMACVKKLGEENIDLRIAILEASRITFEHVFENGNYGDGEPDSIIVKRDNFGQYHKASRLIGDACKKWSI